MKIGLTGGIGCGKSTFGKLLAAHGWRLTQSDLIAREILATPETAARVAEIFGSGVIGADGLPDRTALGKIVFADPAALAALEAEIHPRVRERWEAALRVEPDARHVVEIPLLFEKNLEGAFDLTVCVFCSHDTQLARLQDRGLPAESALARMRAQLPVAEKVRRAGLAIFNEGSPAFLAAQAARLTTAFPLTSPTTNTKPDLFL